MVTLQELLPAAPPNPPLPRLLLARSPTAFTGFRLNTIGAKTTTRRSTGQTATDFWFYPLIAVTPDVNGDLSVTWSYTNFFDGSQAYASGDINNVFSSLSAGQRQELELRDTRPDADPSRGEAIAIGDKDFEALHAIDGLWHSFESRVTVRVESPSGASATLNGRLGPEDFKCSKTLSAEFVGFPVTRR